MKQKYFYFSDSNKRWQRELLIADIQNQELVSVFRSCFCTVHRRRGSPAKKILSQVKKVKKALSGEVKRSGKHCPFFHHDVALALVRFLVLDELFIVVSILTPVRLIMESVQDENIPS